MEEKVFVSVPRQAMKVFIGALSGFRNAPARLSIFFVFLDNERFNQACVTLAT
jgi:hypothetical protein